MEKVKNKKIKSSVKVVQLLPGLFFMLIGAVCGVLIMEYMEKMVEANKTIGTIALSVVLLFIGMYIALFLQIILHEAGHLLFGLLTGYRFSSFRIGSFMWIKEGDKVRLRRLSIAGTGGQCLMIPPDMVDGKMPYILYNLGGSIVNILSAALFIIPYVICRNIPVISILMLMFIIIGVAFALMNGIPMRMGEINNDGHNAMSVGNNSEAMRSLWIQMKVNEQVSMGIRLKDMPVNWFDVPSDESMKNSMTAVIGVFACNRLMDAMDLEKSDKLMDNLLQMKTGIVGLHRNLMIVDRVYCELVGENKLEKIDEMLDKQQKKFMKSMKNYPSVLRTEYVYALLAEKDTAKAEKIKEKFEKNALRYPYPSEIVSERNLMEYAEKYSNK